MKISSEDRHSQTIRLKQPIERYVKLFCAGITALLSLSLLSIDSLHAQDLGWTPHGLSLTQLLDKSSVVIAGTVTDIKLTETHKSGYGFTTFTICKIDLIFGEIDRTDFRTKGCLLIETPGARAGFTDDAVLNKNARYLLFLQGSLMPHRSNLMYGIPFTRNEHGVFRVIKAEHGVDRVADYNGHPVLSIDRDTMIRVSTHTVGVAGDDKMTMGLSMDEVRQRIVFAAEKLSPNSTHKITDDWRLMR